MPLQLLTRWIFSLLSLAVLISAGWLLYDWWRYEQDSDDWRLWTGLGLLAFSFFGRPLVLLLIGKGGRPPAQPVGEVERVTAPDGTELALERFAGPGPTVILTHGWGLDRSAWRYVESQLVGRRALLAWDLPGLGDTSQPPDKIYDLERFADALAKVIELAGGPVVLVGHSIGGMTIQTLLRRGPTAEVLGAVLVNTTYRRVDRTLIAAPVFTALRPLIIGLLHLQIWLEPLAWLQKWQSYLSGSLHLANRLTAFGPDATRAEQDHAARLAAKARPSVEAKGVLAALRWDATDSLGRLGVPVLTLTGALDLVTRPRAGQRIASAAGGENLHDERTAHNSLMDRSELYAEAIDRFAASVR